MNLLLIALGGALGAVSRYGLASWIVSLSPLQRFPLGTIVVNVIGCFAMGLVASSTVKGGMWDNEQLRLFLMPGLLGGFTTFSAFGLETFALARAGQPLLAGCNVAASVIGSICALWLGTKLRGA